MKAEGGAAVADVQDQASQSRKPFSRRLPARADRHASSLAAKAGGRFGVRPALPAQPRRGRYTLAPARSRKRGRAGAVAGPALRATGCASKTTARGLGDIRLQSTEAQTTAAQPRHAYVFNHVGAHDRPRGERRPAGRCQPIPARLLRGLRLCSGSVRRWRSAGPRGGGLLRYGGLARAGGLARGARRFRCLRVVRRRSRSGRPRRRGGTGSRRRRCCSTGSGSVGHDDVGAGSHSGALRRVEARPPPSSLRPAVRGLLSRHVGEAGDLQPLSTWFTSLPTRPVGTCVVARPTSISTVTVVPAFTSAPAIGVCPMTVLAVRSFFPGTFRNAGASAGRRAAGCRPRPGRCPRHWERLSAGCRPAGAEIVRTWQRRAAARPPAPGGAGPGPTGISEVVRGLAPVRGLARRLPSARDPWAVRHRTRPRRRYADVLNRWRSAATACWPARTRRYRFASRVPTGTGRPGPWQAL